ADGSPDNAVDIAWVQDATGQQPNAYTIRLGDSPTTLQTLTTTFTGMAARFVNQSAGTTYYWQVVPTNNGVEAVNQPIWSYTTAGTASVEDDSINFFTISPNPANSIINIITDENINSVDLYNALGQKVLEDITIINNQINITDVHSGIYFLRATSNLGVQTVQIIKN
ncbi:T9SS type A sorting domain-containing protein, partial [Nonlabens ulvanivorans]